MLPALNSVNHGLYTYKNFSFSDIKKKEVLRMKHLYSFVCPICLGKADSLRRTNTCACAALKLLILLILTFDEGKGTTFFE